MLLPQVLQQGSLAPHNAVILEVISADCLAMQSCRAVLPCSLAVQSARLYPRQAVCIGGLRYLRHLMSTIRCSSLHLASHSPGSSLVSGSLARYHLSQASTNVSKLPTTPYKTTQHDIAEASVAKLRTAWKVDLHARLRHTTSQSQHVLHTT